MNEYRVNLKFKPGDTAFGVSISTGEIHRGIIEDINVTITGDKVVDTTNACHIMRDGNVTRFFRERYLFDTEFQAKEFLRTRVKGENHEQSKRPPIKNPR